MCNNEDDKEKKEPRKRLFFKIGRNLLPQAKDRYPYIYIEHSRIEVDDSSVKLITKNNEVIRLPIAIINALFLGPGTSVTHESIKILAQSNCLVCWVGSDSLLFYAHGATPTSNTRNIKKQAQLSADPRKSLIIARIMFQMRFPDDDLTNKSLKEMMGLEGYRVRALYELKSKEYNTGWKGRVYQPGKMEPSDVTNQILTSANSALYNIITSVVISLGFTPHLGFIHSCSPLPFVYDLADLYKEYLCIDLAFSLSNRLSGVYV
jgi:CRISPR-associated protein Cas1